MEKNGPANISPPPLPPPSTRYNEECRSIVMRYSNEWRATVRRIGRWIDFDAGYKTLVRK